MRARRAVDRIAHLDEAVGRDRVAIGVGRDARRGGGRATQRLEAAALALLEVGGGPYHVRVARRAPEAREVVREPRGRRRRYALERRRLVDARRGRHRERERLS